MEIPECGKPVFIHLRRLPWGVDGMSLQQPVERGAHLLLSRGIRRRRIGHERTQLLVDAADEPIRRVRERKDRLAIEPDTRGEQLCVDGLVGDEPAGLVENRPERTSAQTRRHRCADDIEQRREQIDVLDRQRHPSSGARLARLLDDERHVQRAVVECVAGARIAVIRGEDDRGVVVALRPLQLRDQAPDDLVGRSRVDLAGTGNTAGPIAT